MPIIVGVRHEDFSRDVIANTHKSERRARRITASILRGVPARNAGHNSLVDYSGQHMHTFARSNNLVFHSSRPSGYF